MYGTQGIFIALDDLIKKYAGTQTLELFKQYPKAWDTITKKLSDEDPFFKKVVESQRAWAKRVAKYWFLNDADYKLGYEHIFGKLGF